MNKPLFWSLGFAALILTVLLVYEAGSRKGRVVEAAYWRGEISRLDAAAARKAAAQRETALKAEREAQIKSVILADELAKMEAENEKLENADNCGLGADRVRLLNRQAAN